MPIISSAIRLRRGIDGEFTQASSNVQVSCSIKFTDFEIKEDLECHIVSALFERDGSGDKILFWTNGKRSHVHSWTQIGADKKDDFIALFKPMHLRPSDAMVSNGIIEYSRAIDLNSPDLSRTIARASDTGATTKETLRAVVHTYNELAPSTALSRNEIEMDINPGLSTPSSGGGGIGEPLDD